MSLSRSESRRIPRCNSNRPAFATGPAALAYAAFARGVSSPRDIPPKDKIHRQQIFSHDSSEAVEQAGRHSQITSHFTTWLCQSGTILCNIPRGQNRQFVSQFRATAKGALLGTVVERCVRPSNNFDRCDGSGNNLRFRNGLCKACVQGTSRWLLGYPILLADKNIPNNERR